MLFAGFKYLQGKVPKPYYIEILKIIVLFISPLVALYTKYY